MKLFGKMILTFIAVTSVSTVMAQPAIKYGKKNVFVTVTNLSDRMKVDAPVVITLEDRIMESATVWDNKTEIPCQLDDMDADGTKDELAFVITLKPGEKKKLKVELSIDSVPADRYPTRVHAQMFERKPDKTLEPVTVFVSETDDKYDTLYHHGPAFESDLMAYRIYFDKKQTVDVYGKKQKRLELAETKWYPTDEQLAENYGDDVLRVGESVGVGTLRGWDGKEAVYITPVDKREARVLVNGPVRTIVDMTSFGWEYSGQKIIMVNRYTMYAGHRDVEVSNIMFDKEMKTIPDDVIFCTGVQKMPDSETFSDDKTFLGIWGTDYPVNDTIKYGKQTVGLGVCVPQEYILRKTEDQLNYLFLLHDNNDYQIKYYLVAAAEKEEFGFKNAQEFFQYLTQWKNDLLQPVLVELSYP